MKAHTMTSEGITKPWKDARSAIVLHRDDHKHRHKRRITSITVSKKLNTTHADNHTDRRLVEKETRRVMKSISMLCCAVSVTANTLIEHSHGNHNNDDDDDDIW